MDLHVWLYAASPHIIWVVSIVVFDWSRFVKYFVVNAQVGGAQYSYNVKYEILPVKLGHCTHGGHVQNMSHACFIGFPVVYVGCFAAPFYNPTKKVSTVKHDVFKCHILFVYKM